MKNYNYWKGYSDGQASKERRMDNKEYKEGFDRGKYDKSHGFDYRYD